MDNFKNQYPNYLYPIIVGLNSYIHYSKVNSKYQKKIEYRINIGGTFEQGVGLSKDPYFFEKNMPLLLSIKEKLKKILFWILHPKRSIAKNRANKTVEKILRIDSLLKALSNQKITKDIFIQKVNKLIKGLPNNRPPRLNEQINLIDEIKKHNNNLSVLNK